jgi:hypothetical protein
MRAIPPVDHRWPVTGSHGQGARALVGVVGGQGPAEDDRLQYLPRYLVREVDTDDLARDCSGLRSSSGPGGGQKNNLARVQRQLTCAPRLRSIDAAGTGR